MPTFTADVDGEYDIQVQARLAFSDRAYPDQRESVSSLKLSVGKRRAPAAAPRCPGPSGGMALGAALLGLLLRRRRAAVDCSPVCKHRRPVSMHLNPRMLMAAGLLAASVLACTDTLVEPLVQDRRSWTTGSPSRGACAPRPPTPPGSR